MKRTTWLLALGLLAGGASAGAETAALLPGVSVHLKAARYQPSETDQMWTGWIGAGAGLLRVGETTAYFTADVETILGNRRRPFEANQANYHLEVGADRRVGGATATLFFHHVSRHLVDRPKIQAVDWNVLGARASARLPQGWGLPGLATLGVGHTTQVSLVGYRWEITGQLELDALTRRWGQAYVTGAARLVTTRRSEAFPRSRFLDATAEAGARWRREGRSLELFAAYEHRNDVFLEEPASRDRALLGFRIGYAPGAVFGPQGGAAPTSSPCPWSSR